MTCIISRDINLQYHGYLKGTRDTHERNEVGRPQKSRGTDMHEHRRLQARKNQHHQYQSIYLYATLSGAGQFGRIRAKYQRLNFK